MQTKTVETNTARLATIGQMRGTTIAAHISPVPCVATCRAWFDDAKIPRFKSNPLAKRGGGPVYYSVAAVEKFLRSRVLPGKIQNGGVAI